jgi:hypothetical protein
MIIRPSAQYVSAITDDKRRPPLARQDARQGREEHLVGATQLGAAGLALKHLDLMMKDDQFKLALVLTGGRRDTQQKSQQKIEEGEQHGSAELHQGCSEGESE